MGNQTANPTNQLDQRQGFNPGIGVQPGMSNILPPGGLGSTGLQTQPQGIRQNPDGSFTNPDGSVDWNVGYGPQRDWGGQNVRSGQSAIGTAPPEADSVAPRGTPQWRAAVAARQAWVQQNLTAGRTLADLGFDPTRGGGLAHYQRLGTGYQLPTPGAGPAPGTIPVPTTPTTPGLPTTPGNPIYQPTSGLNSTGLGQRGIGGDPNQMVNNAIPGKGAPIPGMTTDANTTAQKRRKMQSTGGLGMSQPRNFSTTPLRTNRVY